MARNATAKGKKKQSQERFPKEVYDKLQLSRRIAAYNFWVYLHTDGSEGWDPNKTPGSVYLYRSSEYIKNNIFESSWPKIGKVSSS